MVAELWYELAVLGQFQSASALPHPKGTSYGRLSPRFSGAALPTVGRTLCKFYGFAGTRSRHEEAEAVRQHAASD